MEAKGPSKRKIDKTAKTLFDSIVASATAYAKDAAPYIASLPKDERLSNVTKMQDQLIDRVKAELDDPAGVEVISRLLSKAFTHSLAQAVKQQLSTNQGQQQ